MRSRISPSSVLTLGLAIASLAFALWSVQTVALDPGPLHDHAREVLAESPVHQAMETRVAAALSANVPPGVAADPTAVATLVAQTIDQPEFVAAFAAALDQVQDRVVRGTDGPISLDPARVTQAFRAAGANDPQLAAVLASTTPLGVQVPEDNVPDLAHWADLWRAAIRALALFAIVLVSYALLKIEHRVWAIGRVGRWLIAVGVGTLAVFWALPRALLRPLGGWIAVGGAVLGAGDVLVPISLVLIAIGAGAVVAAHRWEVHDRARVLSVIPAATSRSQAASGRWESPV